MSRSGTTNALLFFLVAAAIAALWTAVYGNATKADCTHDESSIDGGHVKILRPATATGCTP